MPITISLIEDDELREEIRGLINSQIKGLVRSEVQKCIHSEVKSTLRSMMTDDRITSITKQIIERLWNHRREMTDLVSKTYKEDFSPKLDSFLASLDKEKLINKLLSERLTLSLKK